MTSAVNTCRSMYSELRESDTNRAQFLGIGGHGPRSFFQG